MTTRRASSEPSTMRSPPVRRTTRPSSSTSPGRSSRRLQRESPGLRANEPAQLPAFGTRACPSRLALTAMDGMEFIGHIGERRYPSSLIVASAMEPALIAGVEAMAKAYGVNLLGSIAKPLTTKKLEAMIRVYMRAPLAESSTAKLPFTSADIAAGLEKGQFEPFFQPKVDVTTQETKGAETLVRWRHPELGFIRPEHFVETAEQDDLIEALTDVVTKAAVQNCANRRKPHRQE